MRGPVAVRFWRSVMPEPNTGCFLWMGTISRGGYGQLDNSRAHRVAWELLRGPIPAGMVIDHMCRVRSCVNPDHLRVVTRRINAIENSNSPIAANAQLTACPNCGGPYSVKGGKHWRSGGRYCKACRSAWYRKERAAGRRKDRRHTYLERASTRAKLLALAAPPQENAGT